MRHTSHISYHLRHCLLFSVPLRSITLIVRLLLLVSFAWCDAQLLQEHPVGLLRPAAAAAAEWRQFTLATARLLLSLAATTGSMLLQLCSGPSLHKQHTQLTHTIPFHLFLFLLTASHHSAVDRARHSHVHLIHLHNSTAICRACHQAVYLSILLHASIF